ncbi:MAG: AI-2E family transporter [Caldilineaceae bacterium]
MMEPSDRNPNSIEEGTHNGADATEAPVAVSGAPAHGQVSAAQVSAAQVSAAQIMAAQIGSQWDMSTKRTVLVILLIATVAIVWISKPVLPILIMAGIIAYLLKPIVDVAERIRIPRGVTTIILSVLILVGIVLAPVLIFPVLYDQLIQIANFNATTIINNLITAIATAIANVAPDRKFEVVGFELPIGELFQQIQQNVNQFQFTFAPTLEQILTYVQQVLGAATNVVGSTAVLSFNLVGGIFQAILSTLLTFVMSMYITKDAPHIRSYFGNLFPRAYQPELEELLRRVGHIWQAFFRGQIVLGLTIGLVTWLALTALGMPGALILGIVAGALEIVPNLGPTLAMIPAVIVALIQGSTNPALADISNLGFALMVVGAYFLIQQFENGLIVPRVIGDSVNLHPVIVMCGVVVGFSIGGILGAFLAAPVLATMRVLGGYIHAKLLDYPPFPAPTHSPRRRIGSYRRIVRGRALARASANKPALPPPNGDGPPVDKTAPQPEAIPSTAENNEPE